MPCKPLFLSKKYSNYHYWLKIAACCLKYLKSHKVHYSSSVSINTTAQAHQPSLGNSSLPILTSLPTLTLPELKSAEHLLFKQSQSLYFSSELAALQSSKPISSKSKLICVSPYLDSDGLLRVGGRLSRSNLEHSQKHPTSMECKTLKGERRMIFIFNIITALNYNQDRGIFCPCGKDALSLPVLIIK